MSDKTKGERNKSAKLTAFQVFMVKAAPPKPKLNAQLARTLNVTPTNIGLIRKGKSWGWL